MRDVNLLPEENQRQEQWRVLRHSFCATFIPLGVLLVVLHVLLVFELSIVEKKLRSPQHQKESAAVFALQQAVSGIKAKGQSFLRADREIVEYFILQPSAANVLASIGNKAEEKVWLTDISVDGIKRVYEIGGQSFNIRLVSEFMLELKKLPYFQEVELVTMGEGSKGKDGEVNFKMICHLK